MASLTTHLVRKGLEAYRSSGVLAPRSLDEEVHLPAWGVTLLVATILFFTFAILAIQYTYGEIITTLASIETPGQAAIIRVSPPDYEEAYSDHPDAPLLSDDEKRIQKPQSEEEVLVIQQKPITSNFLAVTRLLKSKGGRRGKYRGLGIYMLQGLVLSILMAVIGSIDIIRSNIWLYAYWEALMYSFTTGLQLVWTHIVISDPSPKTWRQRFPSREVVGKSWSPTFLYALISKFTVVISLYLCSYLGLANHMFQPVDKLPSVQNSVLALVGSLVLTLAVQLPLEIAITRVRASLLSEDETAIIPFDKTFGGAIAPWDRNTKGAYTVLFKAWKSCSFSSTLRISGVYVKVAAMQLTVLLFGIAAILMELRFVVGDKVLAGWIEKAADAIRTSA